MRDQLPRCPVVVGGGSGIGAAVAALYRDKGANPIVWDIAGEPEVHCDITDAGSIASALTATTECRGTPDHLTITAGIGQSGLLVDESVESWDRVMAINARGPWLVMRTVAKQMIESSVSGSIVVTSSVSARLVDRGMGLYCASKAALSMVTQVAASEWAPHNIRVNAIAPGVTETPMLGGAPTNEGWLAAVANRTPLGRIGQADDIAAAAIALHSLQWVTGQILECDGGLSTYSPINPLGGSQLPSRPR